MKFNLKKLMKYIKPFIFGLLLAFALLFGQAMSDLNLPNYMSQIVNIGIQQNGIENVAPDALSKEGMEFIKTFLNENEKILIEENYKLVKVSEKNSDGKTYESLYKNTQGKDIYVRTVIEENTELNKCFSVATWTFINIAKEFSENSNQSIDIMGSEEGIKDIDLSELYKMMPQLSMIPKEKIMESHDKAAEMDEMLLNQSGIQFSQAFYKELGADLQAMQTGYILKVGLLMLLIALASGIASILVALISSRIAAGVAKNLRRDIFNKVESFSNNEFDKFSTASLITRSTNDVTQIQMVLTIGIRMICYAPLMAIGGAIMAIDKSLSMAWIIVVACLIIVGIIIVVFAIAMPKFKLVQKLVDKLNLVSRENLSGLMVIRAFSTEQLEEKRFEKANDDLTKTNLFVNRVMVFLMPMMMFIMNAITLLIVWSGSHNIADSTMQVGDMMAFMQYAMQVIMSFLFISMLFIFIPRAAVSAERIAEVLETEVIIKDPENPKSFDENKKGLVEFINVNFKYNGAEENTLKDITFTSKPGQTTGIIGSTGSGKSTIVNLILRFYDVTEGQVKVNGVDVRDVAQNDLRDKIGYVPQRGILLSGTIESNLKYGNINATDEEMKLFSEVAQASEFINEKSEKYSSEIAQGGSNVSGGQKQRLSIARALVKKPEIYIFDDSFSALDFKTDIALRKALKKYTEESSVILITQRVNTIIEADQIIVLDEGKIVGLGTHKKLLKTCPEYYEIVSSQLSKGELSNEQ